MRLFTTITRTVFSMAAGALLAATLASAQTAPPASPMTCEQQLDAATGAHLALQKELLQARFQIITMQEQQREQQKKQAEAPKAPAPKADKK